MTSVEKVLLDYPKQFKESILLGRNISFTGVKNVLVCGMGGSALAGEIVKSLFYPDLKIVIVKDYNLPSYLDKSWLVICISYSGNTEETITAYKEAVKLTKHVLVITSGGELKKLSEKNKNKIVLVPLGLQPRMAVFYQSMPVINVLVNSKLVKFDLSKEAAKALTILNTDFKTEAERIANNIKSNIPIFYSSTANEALAMKWKISFNENAKLPSFYNVYPEFNHNEINSYKNSKASFVLFMISDDDDNTRIKMRFNIVSKIFKELGLKVFDLRLFGSTRLSKFIYSVILADYTSCKYADSIGEDSLSVPIVESLKKELAMK